MIFVLDFDRVLFDTDVFSQWLTDNDLSQYSRDSELLDKIKEKFIEQEITWSSFLAAGAIEFMEQYGAQCHIVSSFVSSYRGDNANDNNALEQFQREKILRSGIMKALPKDHLHVTGESKMESLAEIKRQATEPLVFIDDSPQQIKAAEALGYDHIIWMATAAELFTNPSPEQVPSFVAEVGEKVERVCSFNGFRELVSSWEKTEKDQ